MTDQLQEILSAMRAASPQCAGFADRIASLAPAGEAVDEVEVLRADFRALVAGIEKALEEIADAGPKALKYAEQELRAALAEVKEQTP